MAAAAVPLAYQSGRDAGAQAVDAAFPDKVIDLQLPLALIAGGTLVEFVVAAVRGWNAPRGVSPELLSVAVGLVVSTTTMLVGVLIAAKVRAIDLGRLPVAVLKLAAIAIAPGAIVTLAGPILGFIPLGFIVGLVAHFALYFALIGTLFKLDESDTWYCVCVIFLVDLCVYFGLRGWLAGM